MRTGTIDLDGSNDVQMTNFESFDGFTQDSTQGPVRIRHFKIIDAGSGGTNAGLITGKIGGVGVSQILAGDRVSEVGIWATADIKERLATTFLNGVQVGAVPNERRQPCS